jgi:hypothetical protein
MNKGQIRTQFLALLNRNDCTNDLADTFIEQSLARVQRTLRVPAMEKSVSYTVNDVVGEMLVLPADFLNAKYLYCDDVLLEYVDLQRFLQHAKTGYSPAVYTRIQGALKIRPVPAEGTELLLVYHAEVPDFTNDSSTNFLSEIAPDLLVYGALSYAADYYMDDRKPAFEETFSRVYGQLEEQAYLTEMEQSGMRVTPAYSDY